MQQTTSEVTTSTLWNTDQTGGGLWSHPASANAVAPCRNQVQITDQALPSPWFLCGSQETHLEGSLGRWALVADTWYPLQNALSPVPRTDPLQMQDYSSATGNESPIAPLQEDNANSRYARLKQYTRSVFHTETHKCRPIEHTFWFTLAHSYCTNIHL